MSKYLIDLFDLIIRDLCLGSPRQSKAWLEFYVYWPFERVSSESRFLFRTSVLYLRIYRDIWYYFFLFLVVIFPHSAETDADSRVSASKDLRPSRVRSPQVFSSSVTCFGMHQYVGDWFPFCLCYRHLSFSLAFSLSPFPFSLFPIYSSSRRAWELSSSSKIKVWEDAPNYFYPMTSSGAFHYWKKLTFLTFHSNLERKIINLKFSARELRRKVWIPQIIFSKGSSQSGYF